MTDAHPDSNTILHVEDSLSDQELIAMAWSEIQCDAELVQAGTCEAAIDHIRAAQAADQLPAMILLDLNLPGCHGTDLLQFLNEASISVPVWVLTSSANPRDRRICDELGAAAYHVKPMSYDGLVDLVRQLCQDLSH